MAVRVVRLGTPRLPDEGLRIGTLRRPPRGVKKSDYASGNWYDVWFPNLAPSPETLKRVQSARTDKEWKAFVRGKYGSDPSLTFLETPVVVDNVVEAIITDE